MGCVSSKNFKKEFKKDLLYNHHTVSLTSTTYGALKLDQELPIQVQIPIKDKERKISTPPRRSLRKSPNKGTEEPEVINAWELMSDLEEDMGTNSTTPLKKISKEFVEIGSGRNRSRFFTQIASPKKQKKVSGKENKQSPRKGRFDATPSPSPKQILRPFNSTGNLRKKVLPTLRLPLKSTPMDLLNRNNFKVDSGNSTSRRSLSPLFNPELIASMERELQVGEEEIKKMVSITPKPRKSKAKESEMMLESFEKKCPPGGENAVIIYTTTLRGIRRTFEDCNNVRSVMESHQIQMFERDISMDSGYREELRMIMGKKVVNVPLVFVKGRLIGGVNEVLKLEEEGKLEILFDGVPKATAPCEGCGGMRFVMCMDCSGSCKVLDEVEKKMVKCEECNENGLIHCPICC
ncbi:Glutaredoxin [Thalictrum thalictroides]|uniref:Glutaredoxin n=1 Tax=Thalictrum thalictroides TaxID=46969 RepID=A0A7J6V371_THATH|nr:Glutaredoxin [Thalictrum thalictroides]